MTTVEIEADVPESRQVTITLPPGVPTGRAKLTVTVADPEPDLSEIGNWLYRPTDPALAAEYDAFVRLLPSLLKTHHRQYVGMSDGAVVAAADTLDAVDRLTLAACGTARVYYARVILPWEEQVFSGVVHLTGRVNNG